MNWPFEIEMAGNGKGDWFTSHLLRLISKADWENTEKLRTVYPDHVAAYERWLHREGEFAPKVGERTSGPDWSTTA